MKEAVFPILGPFGWPKHENGLPPVLNIPGVYLMTVKHQDGFLPCSVGITRRPLRKRFMEHTRSYMKGEYNILDMDSAYQGIRKVIWKGWGWTPEKRADYDSRKNEIVALAQRQMTETAIFIINTGTSFRVLERIEGAIGLHFYKQDESLFDRGMLLMPRWESEEPVLATFHCDKKLYGLPLKIEI